MRTTALSRWVTVLLRVGLQICGWALVFMAFSDSPVYAHKKPEIDPGSLKGSLMLLGGGVLLVADRFWRRRKG